MYIERKNSPWLLGVTHTGKTQWVFQYLTVDVPQGSADS